MRKIETMTEGVSAVSFPQYTLREIAQINARLSRLEKQSRKRSASDAFMESFCPHIDPDQFNSVLRDAVDLSVVEETQLYRLMTEYPNSPPMSAMIQLCKDQSVEDPATPEHETISLERMKPYGQKLLAAFLQHENATLKASTIIPPISVASPIMSDQTEKLKQELTKIRRELEMSKKSTDNFSAGCKQAIRDLEAAKKEYADFIQRHNQEGRMLFNRIGQLLDESRLEADDLRRAIREQLTTGRGLFASPQSK